MVKDTKPTITFRKAVIMLNFLTSHKSFFVCLFVFFTAKMKLSDFQLCSAGLHMTL